MIIIPAIDLIDGQCVRLIKGDFTQKTVYAEDPIEVAKGFQAQGAQFLHVVDLSGAKQKQSQQTDLIHKIVKKTSLNVQTGGGIRTEAQIKQLIDNGIQRIVIGSLSVILPNLVQNWLNNFGKDCIVLALDVFMKNNKPYLSINGWQENSDILLWDLLNRYNNVKHVLCTDISRDGMLQGPNFGLYERFKKKFPDIKLQASGGISSSDDIRQLKESGIDAVIIGKAIYEGKINLSKLF